MTFLSNASQLCISYNKKDDSYGKIPTDHMPKVFGLSESTYHYSFFSRIVAAVFAVFHVPSVNILMLPFSFADDLQIKQLEEPSLLIP